jgi:hypothetical protein
MHKEVDVHLRSSAGHPKQHLLRTSPAKRKIIKAGRRSGKTTGVAQLSCERFLKGHRILYGVPTGDQLERYWRECCAAMEQLVANGIVAKNETEHTLVWEEPYRKNLFPDRDKANIPRIRAASTWDAENLRGDAADLAILDEFQLMNENAWKRVIAPMLIDTGGDAVFCYTPPSLISRASTVTTKAQDPGYASTLFRRAQEEMERAETEGRESRWLALHFTSHDNPFLSSEGLSEISLDISGSDYQREIMAEDIIDDEIILREEWLRYFKYKESDPTKPLDDPTNFLFITYEKYKDEPAPEDIPAGSLELRLIIDPNHAGKRGRCKHGIVVTGFDSSTLRFHLLDQWADSCGYRDFGEKVFKMADKWGIYDPWIESVASQIYCKLYFEELQQKRERKLIFRELPQDLRANAKDRRIEGLEPFCRNGQWYVHRSHSRWLQEYKTYYRGKMIDVDLLDCSGYAPQLYDMIRKREVMASMRRREQAFRDRQVGVGGY